MINKQLRGAAAVVMILLSCRLRAEPVRAILAIFAVAMSTSLGLALYLATTVSNDNFLSAVNTLGKFDAKVQVSAEDIGLAVSVANRLGLNSTVVLEDFGLVNGERAVIRGVVSGSTFNIDGAAAYIGRGCSLAKASGPLDITIAGRNLKVEPRLMENTGGDCSVFLDPAYLSNNAAASILLSCKQTDCEQPLVEFSSSSVVQAKAWSVQSVGARQAARSLAAAFTSNIYLLLVVAALIAAFTIWNSFEISVAGARRDYQALATIGLPSIAIYFSLLLEGAVIGAIGGLFGIFAFPLVAGVYDAARSVIFIHYPALTSESGPFSLPFSTCLVAGLVSIVSTLLGAHLPALKAASLSGAIVNRNNLGLVETRSLSWSWVSWVGAAVCLGSYLFPQVYFTGELLALGVLGVGMGLIPTLINLSSKAIFRLSPAGCLAAGELRAAASSVARTTLFLYVAFALTAALGVMVSSFRSSVESWLSTTFVGDLYLKAESGDLPSELVDFVFKEADKTSETMVIALKQRSLVLGDALVEVQAQDLDSALNLGAVEILARLSGSDWAKFVGISEPFSRKFKKTMGDSVTIAGREFTVSFVARDYSSDRGIVYMGAKAYSDLFNSDEVRSLSLYGLTPDVVSVVRARVAKMPRVSVYNPVELRALALEIFDRTFKITDIVGIIAMVLALVGFVFTAMQLALERKAIIQTVLTIGARLSQAAKMLWFFYLAQVIIAGCLGVVIGGILGWVLAEVINPRYFGWSVEFRLDGAVFTGVPMYMLLACLSIAATAAILEIYGRGFLGSNPEIE